MENSKIKNQNKTSLDHYFGEGAICKKNKSNYDFCKFAFCSFLT